MGIAGKSQLLIVVVALAAVAAVALLLPDARQGAAADRSPSRDAARTAAPAPQFGLGRDELYAAPGATLKGRMYLPEGVAEGDLAWTAEGAVGTSSGTGPDFELQLPKEGIVSLRARLAGGPTVRTTTVRVLPRNALAATDLDVTGTVLVDGKQLVDGEALPNGVVIDAERGRVIYTARATTDGARSGRIRLEGATITLSAAATGERVTNRISLQESTSIEEDTQVLVADVEHLDDTRYVEVDTPNAVAMVKGTRFMVTLADEETTVTVDHGWVEVLDDRPEQGDKTYDVRTEQQVTIGGENDTKPPTVTHVDARTIDKLDNVTMAAPDLRTDPAPKPPKPGDPRPGGPVPPKPGTTTTGTTTTGTQPKVACTNMPEAGEVVPDGYVRRTDGTCVRKVIDACSNIDGEQTVPPAGFVRRTDGTCTQETTQTDVCPNITGDQATVPAGMVITPTGTCGQPIQDMCPNLADVQQVVPAGYVKVSDGTCQRQAPDMCTNLTGIQETVPPGHIRLNDGSCVRELPDLCSNLTGVQNPVPSGWYQRSDGTCGQTTTTSPGGTTTAPAGANSAPTTTTP